MLHLNTGNTGFMILCASLELQLTNDGDLPVDLNTGGTYYYDTVLNDMKFDPEDAARRYAVGAAGAFFTMDGVNWNRLLDATAFPGRPANCYYDFTSDPCRRALYVVPVLAGSCAYAVAEGAWRNELSPLSSCS